MNPITRFATVTLAAITLLIMGALMDGPDDIKTAQPAPCGLFYDPFKQEEFTHAHHP